MPLFGDLSLRLFLLHHCQYFLPTYLPLCSSYYLLITIMLSLIIVIKLPLLVFHCHYLYIISIHHHHTTLPHSSPYLSSSLFHHNLSSIFITVNFTLFILVYAFTLFFFHTIILFFPSSMIQKSISKLFSFIRNFYLFYFPSRFFHSFLHSFPSLFITYIYIRFLGLCLSWEASHLRSSVSGQGPGLLPPSAPHTHFLSPLHLPRSSPLSSFFPSAHQSFSILSFLSHLHLDYQLPWHPLISLFLSLIVSLIIYFVFILPFYFSLFLSYFFSLLAFLFSFILCSVCLFILSLRIFVRFFFLSYCVPLSSPPSLSLLPHFSHLSQSSHFSPG